MPQIVDTGSRQYKSYTAGPASRSSRNLAAMLAYRHAFHAGNHADVLKHAVLLHVLEYMCRKDKAFWYIETHAGAGRYRLDRGPGAKTREWEGGIGALWQSPSLPGLLERYRELVKQLNPDGRPRHYPGSPLIAATLARAQDRLWFSELHSTDHAALEKQFSSDRRVRVDCRDGLAALKALLPPAPRRALVMLDPSWELKQDIAPTLSALGDALRRFPSGTYLVWYPRIAQREVLRIPERLQALHPPTWLDARLDVRASRPQSGLHGSGMFVINPPYTLREELGHALDVLVRLLGADAGAGCELREGGG